MSSSGATETELPEPRDILYINVSRIGDTLLVTPAVRAVAARWPQARIHLLAHPKREEVLRFLPFIHRTGTIEKQRARFMGWVGNPFAGKPYDLAFVCNFDAPLVEYALRVARRVVAFRQPDAALNARLYKAVEHPALQATHAVDIQLMLPAAVGAAPAGKALSYRVTADEAQWAAGFLAKHGAEQKHPLIGLQVASFPTKAYRDWPPGHFSELCRRIRGRWPQAHFLIFGGELEKSRTEALASELGGGATLCAGKLSLRETAALMSRVDLYVGVDTGPTHLMGAMQRPMVALYHGYSPSRVLAPLDHPCLYAIDHPLADRCTPEADMAEITVDRVWAAVQQALGERATETRVA
ncbi:glycosyltransferase family 9 protein [Sulfuritalea sp.]|uniref:glycosyltransferase family 9 protein n=1 Tax=Sulfuritalea sp. TaxID=2480090 RepID=UPI00286D78E6|nr:glycosyltransferase family 9 protein [Sulfuritalea sp.]